MNVRHDIAYLIILLFVAIAFGVPLYRRQAKRRRRRNSNRARIDIISREP